MSVTSANRYLTQTEMEGNADAITAFFLSYGWTLNAIAGMLGNMQTESTINPGIHQSLDASSSTNGYGLVQWTPKTKYFEWADEYEPLSGYDDIYAQCRRILFEVENGLQWITTNAYPISFVNFTKSTAAPEYLAQAFLFNYERPANLDQMQRSKQARAWYTYIQSYIAPDDPLIPDTPVTPTTSQKKGMSKLLLYFAGTRRR